MSNSSLASLCSSGNIPDPSLFGAEILSLTSNLVSNYSTYVPETYNYNHPSVSVENVDYCNITVTYTHPGQNDRINVEAWLPLDWNERLMAVGGGGLVAGRFVLSYFFMAGAIGQGYATVTTDAGTSTDPATGLTELLLEPGNIDWNAVQNFGSRALNDEVGTGSLFGRSSPRSRARAYERPAVHNRKGPG
jgi:feruloyl esterase